MVVEHVVQGFTQDVGIHAQSYVHGVVDHPGEHEHPPRAGADSHARDERVSGIGEQAGAFDVGARQTDHLPLTRHDGLVERFRGRGRRRRHRGGVLEEPSGSTGDVGTHANVVPDAQRLDEPADHLADRATRGRFTQNAAERDDSIPLGTDGVGLREARIDGAGKPGTNGLEILETLVGRIIRRQPARQKQHPSGGEAEAHDTEGCPPRRALASSIAPRLR